MDKRERLQKEKQKKKERKKNRQAKKLAIEEAIKKTEEQRQQQQQEVIAPEDEVEIEYVVVNPFESADPEDAAELKKIFEAFTFKEPEEVEEEAAEPVKVEAPVKEEKLSKKKRKLQRRLPIAVLKSLVDRPDLVEVHDTSAANPFLLLHLKAYRNAVPVPRHWSQKRKYLQGKRGVEKTPFELPEFIKATGIMDMRNAALEKEAHKNLKQKARDRMNPSMGRLDIDYNTLHDAFFKHQTKPKLTVFGDVYFEGKEYEVEMHEKRPGALSQKLREALGMGDTSPPPWLHNQQRVGLPPSYPHLKIPGLNAPLPVGCEYGYHMGGWGRSPIDSDGHPIYPEALRDPHEIEQQRGIGFSHWGAIAPQEISSSSSEEEEQMENEEGGEGGEGDVTEPTASDQGIPGIETPLSGIETPTNLEGALRKRKATKETKPGELYKVLEEQEVSVGSGELYGSSHKYVIDKPKPPPPPGPAGDHVDLMKSRKTDAIEMSIDPDDLNDEESLRKKFEKAVEDPSKKRKQAAQPTKPPAKKKKKTDKSGKEFKF